MLRADEISCHGRHPIKGARIGPAEGLVEIANRLHLDLPEACLVERREIPGQWPPGRFDLVVLSEILYYFSDHDLEQVLEHAAASLEPDGTLLAVHWRHPVAEYPRTGDDVHRVLAAHPGLSRLSVHAEADFLAEVYIRTEGTPASVAQATGLV